MRAHLREGDAVLGDETLPGRPSLAHAHPERAGGGWAGVEAGERVGSRAEQVLSTRGGRVALRGTDCFEARSSQAQQLFTGNVSKTSGEERPNIEAYSFLI